MQLFSTITAAIVAIAAMVLVIAEQEVHIKLRVSHDKLYVTPNGHRCAYNNCVDPTVYPCADKGVCMRQNYTYGVCSNKPEDLKVKQNYDDPKLKCPFPNPYSHKSER
ncbi:unnamed protein product [Peronospora farinosa]|uniref:Uncharacterized protein n=1 Tax=Peronospora farinosa TaxID=134698 RepID=A0AAV0SQ56_9STRA|nr:unnamed protein product [Peronospora farinosa]CAI5705553.1 unnamed protein product [Peronospora farinosa]